MTARWVVEEVAERRDLSITWQPISLLFKNNPAETSSYYQKSTTTHKMLRVMESVRSVDGNQALSSLYWEFASRIHHDKDLDFDIADALSATELDRSHAKAADEEQWDSIIRERMAAGLELVGDDVGTPIIAWNSSDKTRIGIFGPVITRVPKGPDALKLWDAMVMLGDIDGFWELKKTRNQSPEFGERPN